MTEEVISPPIVYHYDNDTKEYRYSGPVRPDPIEQGRWLYPRNCTELEPPLVNEPNKVVIFNEVTKKWEVKVDYRGTVINCPNDYYPPITINTIGVKPDSIEFPEPPAESYKVKRMKEYPATGDQLDAIMKWVSSSEEELPQDLKDLAAKCMAVKEKYPKVEDNADQ